MTRSHVAFSPNVSPEQLDRMTNDPDEYVRSSVAESKFAHKRHLDKLSNDPDIHVQKTAIENLQKRFQ